MARDDYDDDDYDDDRPRSRRRSSSSNNTVLILVLVGGLGAAFFCCILILPALLLPAVQQAREAARRTQSKNSLKQIGLAAHVFHDTHGHLPPLELKPDEQPQSWMTELLPYMDQMALYSLINRQAPWDDPSNRGATGVVVPSYLDPSHPGPSRDPATGMAMAHYAGNPFLFRQDEPVKIGGIRDGTSNTMLAGSIVAGERPWADVENLRDPANGVGTGPTQFLHGFAGSGGAHILMADGTVRFISSNTAPEVMQALAQPDDGVVPPPNY